MDENREHEIVEERETAPGWIAPVVGVLALIAIIGLGLAWYDASQLSAAQASVSSQFKSEQQSTAQQMNAVQQKEAQEEAANAQLQSDLGVVTKKLRVTQSDLTKARQEAAQMHDDSDQKIAQVGTNVTDVQTQLQTKASTDDLNATNGQVTGVKTDLDSTKNDLKMARSELGTLIARDHDDIDQLRRMGERDYVEFTVTGRNKPAKVGGVTVELRSVNAKQNQFSVSLLVNDRSERKSGTVDEPIFFYPNGTHSAHFADEFVVNSVGKDTIKGYISMPKEQGAGATTASGF